MEMNTVVYQRNVYLRLEIGGATETMKIHTNPLKITAAVFHSYIHFT